MIRRDCIKKGHEGCEIQGLCLNFECKTYICTQCLLKGTHYDHSDQILFVKDFRKKDIFNPDYLDNLISQIKLISRKICKFLKEIHDFCQNVMSRNLQLAQFFFEFTDSNHIFNESDVCENLLYIKQQKQSQLIQQTKVELKQFFEQFQQFRSKIISYQKGLSFPKTTEADRSNKSQDTQGTTNTKPTNTVEKRSPQLYVLPKIPKKAWTK